MNYEHRHTSILSSLLNDNINTDICIADLDVKQVLEEAEIHGVISLIYERFSSKDIQIDQKLVQQLFKSLKSKNVSNAVFINVIHKEAFELINELNLNNFQYVVLKGFALAHSTYSAPELRPSVDIDILIDENDIERSKVILLKKGYHNIKEWEPKEVHHQFTYSKSLLQNITCHWDVHRVISNDLEVSNLLPFSEIYDSHCVITSGSTCFKSISKPYAFIHASIHFLRHKYRKDMVRLIWLYDLFVLAEKMTKSENEEFILLVKNKCISNVIVQAIEDTKVHFQSESLIVLQNSVQNLPSGNQLNYLLDNHKNGIQRFVQQLQATKNFRSAIILMRETLLPPKEQIYLKYGKVSNKSLWFYYLKRIVNGMAKWARK